MGTLFIVATPIGNLEDITLRALRVLKEADYVLCEDTRVTKKLFEHYQIKTLTLSYHQHSGKARVNLIIELLKSGKNLALVADAGTPCISDPGSQLVAEVLTIKKDDCNVVPIPGPSAITSAISVSGMQIDKFLFFGFLPHKKGRQTLLKKISESEYPVVLYESVHRIGKLLEELSDQNYQLVVCRELTKKFETIYRGTVEEVKAKLKKEEIKGEFVVIIYKK